MRHNKYISAATEPNRYMFRRVFQFRQSGSVHGPALSGRVYVFAVSLSFLPFVPALSTPLCLCLSAFETLLLPSWCIRTTHRGVCLSASSQPKFWPGELVSARAPVASSLNQVTKKKLLSGALSRYSLPIDKTWEHSQASSAVLVARADRKQVMTHAKHVWPGKINGYNIADPFTR